MIHRIQWPLAACLALLLSGCVAPLHRTVDPAARAAANPRPVLVTIPQAELDSSIIQSNMTAAMGGGLLFALIDAGVNNSRAKAAEKAILPVRDALVGYPFDQKAVDALHGLADLPWLAAGDMTLNKDASSAHLSQALDAAPSSQLVSVVVHYDLSPDFGAARVSADVSILAKAVPQGARPEARLQPANAVFTRTFLCVAPVRDAGKDLGANAQQWTRDNGAALRQAFDALLARLAAIARQGLDTTAEQDSAYAKAPRANGGGFSGTLVQRDAQGVLLQDVAGQWIYSYDSPIG